MNKVKNILAVIAKPALVMIVLFGLIGLSLWLKEHSKLSEPSFMALVTLSAILSVLLPNLNQLKSFSIARGELILQEVKDSEAAVKELALATVELVDAGTDGLLATHHFSQERYDEAVSRIKSLTTNT